MNEQKATLQCARCGSTELRAQVPAEELSAAELMKLAMAKLEQEQALPPAPVVVTDHPEQEAPARPSSVPQIIADVDALEALERSSWVVKHWLTPNRWIPWVSRVSSARCEVCGKPIGLGEEVRWLPADRAPGGDGLTMHQDCWEEVQRELD